MTGTLVIPDVHNKWALMEPVANGIMDSGAVSRVVFLGDLVNDWDCSPGQEIESLERLTEWVLDTRKSIPVDVLLGNHDLPYFIESDKEVREVIKYSPGFLMENRPLVGSMLREELRPIIATTIDTQDGRTAVATHAGVHHEWLDLACGQPSESLSKDEAVKVINQMMTNKRWGMLMSCGRERGGFDKYSSPLWAGASEINLYGAFDYQLVGHTPSLARSSARTNGREVVYLDTWSTYRNGNPIGDRSLHVF